MLTILPPAFAGEEVAGEELRELEEAGEVDLEDVLPVGEFEVFGGRAEDGSGVVDEDVDVAEVGFDLGEEVGRPLRAGEVCAEGVGVVADGVWAVDVAARRLPWTATWAPAWARASAMEAPRPLAAPVMRATLPSRRKRSRMLGVVGMSVVTVLGARG